MYSHNPNSGSRSALPITKGHCFDPTANNFAPLGRNNQTQSQSNMSKPMSTPPSPYLEARVLNLEEEHASLRGDVDTLKELFHDLSFSVEKLGKGGWPVKVSPFQDVDITKSHQRATQLKSILEMQSVDGSVDMPKVNNMGASKMNNGISTSTKSIPPHLRGARNEVSVTNG